MSTRWTVDGKLIELMGMLGKDFSKEYSADELKQRGLLETAEMLFEYRLVDKENDAYKINQKGQSFYKGIECKIMEIS